MHPRPRFFIFVIITTVVMATFNIFYQLSFSIEHRPVNDAPQCEINSKSRLNKFLLQRGKSHVTNSHNFSYVLNPCDVCTNTPIELVICVTVAREDFEARRVITETWGSYAHDAKNQALLLFFIGNGTKDEHPDVNKAIINESLTCNDIIQEDYIDSYRNLSLKSVSVLKWISLYCPHARFILKVDSDVYVNVPNLIPILRRLNRKIRDKFILGSMFSRNKPIKDRQSKYYTNTQEFSGRVYPMYVSGTAYSMSGVAARQLFIASLETPLFWLEDVFITGLCARKAGLRTVHNEGQKFSKVKPSGCQFKTLTSAHGYTGPQIEYIYKELNDPNLKC